jgi:hypothetical protein
MKKIKLNKENYIGSLPLTRKIEIENCCWSSLLGGCAGELMDVKSMLKIV